MNRIHDVWNYIYREVASSMKHTFIAVVLQSNFEILALDFKNTIYEALSYE